MKKCILGCLIMLSLISILGAADFKIHYNFIPGKEDEIGQKLCSLVNDMLSSSKQWEVVPEDGIPQVFTLKLMTVKPALPEAKMEGSCFTYELLYNVKDMPPVYVNSFMDFCPLDRIDKTAAFLNDKVTEDASVFLKTYSPVQKTEPPTKPTKGKK
ncbi:MAG TPA: hypothetical protein PLF50_02400 [Candidatus Cloacimonadota bacterium]|nr:hypothetical protein [Candidatus Cloacimonadota bacterium]